MNPVSSPNNRDNRSEEIGAFLQEQGLCPNSTVFLAGDASFRKYYRIWNKGSSLVLMDAPPPENPAQFMKMTQLLNMHGFSAPQVLASDLNRGFLLLEDFGNRTYTTILKKTSPRHQKKLYFLAVDTLIRLHQRLEIRPEGVESYTADKHLAEAMLLLQWAYPALTGREPDSEIRLSYQTLWNRHLLSALDGPHSLVLRDFHVDNLMILPHRSGLQRCGMLDFQDALWGSVTYDLVSLLEDARRDVPEALANACWARYLKAFPGRDRTALQQQAVTLSAARHAKIIGIFTRLALRDKKTHYLCHIPRLWKLLQKCLDHPSLSDLNGWFLKNIPLEDRKTPHV
jgi:aminoglycoside/choline kinase family phosphotransferase